MALKDDLLPIIDPLRAIAGELGFRPYQVWVRVTTYTGTRLSPGTPTVVETKLLVGGQNPKVRAQRTKDVSAGTSELTDTVWEIGPLTPSFPGGGYSQVVLDPEKTAASSTVLYRLVGPGLPTTGLLCQRIADDVDRPLRAVIRVTSAGVKA